MPFVLPFVDNLHACLQVSNQGDAAIEPPWTFSVTSPTYRQIDQIWNIDQKGNTATDGTITSVASLFWEILTPASGNFVQVGFVVRSTANSFNPTRAIVNGAVCSINGVTPQDVTTLSLLPVNPDVAAASTSINAYESVTGLLILANGTALGPVPAATPAVLPPVAAAAGSLVDTAGV